MFFRSYRVNKRPRLVAAVETTEAYEPVKRHEVTSGIQGWLNYKAIIRYLLPNRDTIAVADLPVLVITVGHNYINIDMYWP